MTQPLAPPPPRLLDRVRAALRTRHCSLRTEKAYVGWIRRYIVFHGKRHPAEMGAAEITRFLSALAIQRNVAASTQNQALSALLFLYRDVLEQELPWLDDIVRDRDRPADPLVHPEEPIEQSSEEWNELEFRPHIAGGRSRPVDLREEHLKPIAGEVLRNHGDVALAPAPGIDKRVRDPHDANRYAEDSEGQNSKTAVQLFQGDRLSRSR